MDCQYLKSSLLRFSHFFDIDSRQARAVSGILEVDEAASWGG